MDFDEKNEKPNVSALELEKAVYDLVKEYQSKYKGAKKPGIINKGFYYFFLKNRHRIGYSLGSGTFNDSFDKIFNNKKKFTKVLKAWSAKFNRYLKGSIKIIEQDDPNHIIQEPTLINQLSICDFIVLTEGLDDWELIKLLRGEGYLNRKLYGSEKKGAD